MRSTAFCLVIACLILSTPSSHLQAQERITTPPVVSSLWEYNGAIHALALGVDGNYDGAQDSTDEPATWLVVDPTTRAITSQYVFPWADITAKHFGFDPYLGLMFIALDDTVWAYTATTQQRSSSPVLHGSDITSVAYDVPTGKLYTSHRPSYTDPGYITILDPTAGSRTEVDVAVNPQMIEFYTRGTTSLPLVLCEGTFGNMDGSLVFINADNTIAELVVGDTPNNVAIDNARGLAYVTMTGSHEVVIVDVISRTVAGRFPTPTSGYDGPREIALHENFAFVTTYAGTVLMFDRGLQGDDLQLTLRRSFDVGDKCDPVLVAFDHLWVGATYAGTSYDPATDIIVFPLNTVSVRESDDESRFDDVHWSPHTYAVDLRGVRMPLVVRNGEIDRSQLAPGVYIITDGHTTRTILLP